VSRRKPDPMIYEMAADRLNIPHEKCIVIEDSLIGLAAAKGANMKCLITYTPSTAKENFYGNGADATVKNLAGIHLDEIIASYLDLLAHKRDKKA
jgi:beta-phosphoglucomutase-like phosphatase (HAD superfamily)